MKLKYLLLIVLISLLAGMGIAVWRISSVTKNGVYAKYGSWKGSTHLALNKNDLVTTQATLFALFVLPSEEAVYLFATEDNMGEQLKSNCTYEIEGNIHRMKAVYWSITAYGKDLFLIPNEENRYSFNYNNLQTDSAGNFKITVSETKSPGN